MSERSTRDLYWGIVAIAIGVLYTGVELYYLTVFGQHSEPFSGWWLMVYAVVVGVFLLMRYCSDRVRRFSDAVGESRHYKAFWILVCLALAAFGGWLMYLVGTDFGSEGAVGVFGFGAVMCVIGLVATGIGLKRLHYS